ncbi:hypothetical protein ZOSMA_1135G00010 [Zostera marina]|uniref:Uncharacterized protein n=1 Tax=Zostera marina TaxID=29655 RepID=A0A0K9Q542_ZOSMR|nr:hypothetical protein ZOSMA_1135G00010 [Zostera marina]
MTRSYIISFIIKSQFSPFTNPKPSISPKYFPELSFSSDFPQALLLAGFPPSSPSCRIFRNSPSRRRSYIYFSGSFQSR